MASRSLPVESSRLNETLPHGDFLPHTLASRRISRALQRIAGALSWVWLALLGAIVLNVTMRYAFGQGRIEFEEIQWHLYSIGFLVGLSACLDTDDHIRVDVLNARLHPRTRAWIELYGILLLFFPFVLLVLIHSLPFVAYSFATGEVSDSAAGLPLRWLIKAMLPAGFLLLAVAGLGRLLRVLAYLFGAPGAPPVSEAAGSDRHADR